VISWATAFQLRQRLKNSLWVLPLLGGVVGVAGAQVDLALEDRVHLPVSWQYSASTVSSVLAAIIGAMISLLGLVVTVSVLVVQQATGTLSPRYMRLWYRDRLQKVVIATFVGTFAFAYSLLRRVEEGTVPVLGVTLAGFAAGASLVLLLFYVNRFTHNLRPVAVAAAVAAAGQKVLFEQAGEWRARRPALVGDVRRPGGPLLTVRAPRYGTIQALAGKRLVHAARRHDCVLVLMHGVGDFLPEGTALIEVYGSSAPDRRLLEGLVATGIERTIEQDPAFALRILVDIAIRALSPAVNDATTAVQVLDYIEQLLQSLAPLPLSSSYALCDDEGHLRAVVPGRSWDNFLFLAVTEIRLHGATAPQVDRRLRAVLEGLLTAPAGHRAAVWAELVRLDASIDETFSDADMHAFVRSSDRQGIGGRAVEAARDGSPPSGDAGCPASPDSPGRPWAVTGPADGRRT
jgi:uncharacterized membrane protein